MQLVGNSISDIPTQILWLKVLSLQINSSARELAYVRNILQNNDKDSVDYNKIEGLLDMKIFKHSERYFPHNLEMVLRFFLYGDY